MKTIRAIMLAVAFATPVVAQDLGPKAAPQTRPIVIENATLHTVSSGTIENGRIIFEKGIIRAVLRPGETADFESTLDDPVVIAAAGAHLYPGFVCVASAMGLTEVGSVDMTKDAQEAGRLKPEVEAAIAINCDSTIIPVSRRNGVLTCGVFPAGGLVSGRASVISMDAWTWEEAMILRDAGIVVNWPFIGRRGRGRGRRRGPPPPTTVNRSEAEIAELDALLDAAIAHRAARRADAKVSPDLRLEAMASVLEKKRPVFVNAASARQIASAVLWGARRGVEVVIVGGRDAALCTELLKAHGTRVAITSSHRLPGRRDVPAASTYELPGVLEAAGVRWAMTMAPSGAANVRCLPFEIGACIAHGLDPEVALRAVTLSAAECLGVAEQLGSLDVGKRATFFFATGNPLDVISHLDRAWIDGKEISLEDKQTALAEKYRTRYRQMGLVK